MEAVTVIRVGEPSGLLPDPELFPAEELLTGFYDAQGNPVRVPASEVPSAGWFIPGDNGAGEEPTAYGTSDVVKITIYNRSVVEVLADDAVLIRGNVWKVTGVVESWASPWGSALGGTAVTVERAG